MSLSSFSPAGLLGARIGQHDPAVRYEPPKNGCPAGVREDFKSFAGIPPVKAAPRGAILPNLARCSVRVLGHLFGD